MTDKPDEIDLIIKRNTMGGSGKFDAKSAIPQFQALISTEIAKAKIEEFWKLHDLEFNYEPNEPCAYCSGEAHSLRHDILTDHYATLADTESNKEGVEVNE